MSLVESCEPLFQYVCGLNRAVNKGADLQAVAVKKKVKAIFEEIREQCSLSQTLLRQFESMELPLIFFVDFIISESPSRFAKNWEPLAFDRDELAGDDKFFKLLDETLEASGGDAEEQLAVFHTCLGLGFTGIYASDGPQAEPLRKIRKTVADRVLRSSSAPSAGRLAPPAYQNVDRSNLIEGGGLRIWALAVLLIGMIALLVVVNYFQFQWESEGMDTSIATILKKTGAKAGGAPDGGEKGESK